MAGEKDNLRTGSQTAATVEEVVDVEIASALASCPGPFEALPPVSEARRQQSLGEHAFEVDTFVDDAATAAAASGGGGGGPAHPETVLYLAYGSNLCAKTFRGHRGIRPLAEVNVLVPELRLNFELPGLPYVEPCFANVGWRHAPSLSKQEDVAGDAHAERAPLLAADHDHHEGGRNNSGRGQPPPRRRDAWQKGLVGVVYEVTMTDYATIIATEGGGNSYQDILVDCYALPDADTVPERPSGPAFKAHTLCAPTSAFAPPPPAGKPSAPAPAAAVKRVRQRPNPGYAQPSARYLKLLTDGAAEHRLPAEYQAHLHTLQPYTITQTRQRVGRLVFIALWYPVIMALFAGQKLLADARGRSPRWYARVGEAVFTGVWTSYDRVFKRLFGDGERTVDPEAGGVQADDAPAAQFGAGAPSLVESGGERAYRTLS